MTHTETAINKNHTTATLSEAIELGTNELREFYANKTMAVKHTVLGNTVTIAPADSDCEMHTMWTFDVSGSYEALYNAEYDYCIKYQSLTPDAAHVNAMAKVNKTKGVVKGQRNFRY